MNSRYSISIPASNLPRKKCKAAYSYLPIIIQSADIPLKNSSSKIINLPSSKKDHKLEAPSLEQFTTTSRNARLRKNYPRTEDIQLKIVQQRPPADFSIQPITQSPPKETRRPNRLTKISQRKTPTVRKSTCNEESNSLEKNRIRKNNDYFKSAGKEISYKKVSSPKVTPGRDLNSFRKLNEEFLNKFVEEFQGTTPKPWSTEHSECSSFDN